MGELDRELARQQAEARDASGRFRDPETFAAMLVLVSGDGSGTAPEELLSEGDAQVCQDFMHRAAELQFPGAQPIDLKVKKTGRPVWKRSPIVFPDTTSALAKAMLLRTEWQGEGYAIGRVERQGAYVGVGTTADLMLCTDGLLRCSRRARLWGHVSYGDGYGVVPKGVDAVIGLPEPITGYNDTRNSHEFAQRPLAQVLARYLSR